MARPAKASSYQAAPLPPPLSPEERKGALGDEIVQPLHWLSELQHEVRDLQLEAGRALAVALNGNWPSAAAFASLRQRLHQALDLVDHAERMDAGRVDAKGEVGSFDRSRS